MQKKFFIFTFGVVAFLGSLFLVSNHVDAESVKARITFTRQSVPQNNSIFFVRDVTTIYNKINQGKFTSADKSSSAWAELEREYPTKNGVISLTSYIRIGKGVKNSAQVSQDIIRFFYVNNLSNIVQTFNGGAAQVRVNVPNNIGRSYTDAGGVGEFSAIVGRHYAVYDSKGLFLQIIYVTSKVSSFEVDTLNQDSRFSISVRGLPDAQKSGPGQYNVGYNQSLTFQIHIDKSLLKTGMKLMLSPNANIVIDTPPSGAVVSDTPSSATRLSTDPLYTYMLSIPASEDDQTITFQGHLASTVEDPETDQPIDIFEDLDTQLSVQATLSGSIYSLTTYSPGITTSGINFAMIDSKNSELVPGAEYVLGKISGSAILLYGKEGTWVSTSSLQNLDRSQYQIISGGNLYVIGRPDILTIPLNTSGYAFNAQKDTETNQNLIQVRGLSTGRYFLYQVSAPRGFSVIKTKQYFDVFRRSILAKDGVRLTVSSVGLVSHQFFALNKEIPDFYSGTNEYSPLFLSKTSAPSFDSFVKIIVPILVAAILTLVLLVVIGRWT
jgi:hypothetical protein